MMNVGRAGWLVAALVSLVTTLVVGRARAETVCPPSRTPVVELTLEVRPPDMIIGETLERHLRSELQARSIDMCTAPTSPRIPIARVTLHVDHPAQGACIATVTIGDALTNKRVERTIDLTKLPPDARPLVVAASTDELLRASWSELNLVDAPPPSTAPPPEVVHALESTTRPSPSSPKTFEIAAMAEASRYFGHRTGIGGGVLAGWWFSRPIGAFVRFSTTYGLSEPTVNGHIRADTNDLGLGMAFAPVSPEHAVGVRVEAAVTALRASFEGAAAPGATAEGGSDWTAVASLGARMWIRPGARVDSARITLGASALRSLRPIRATDDGRNVVSIEGFGGELTLGVLIPF